jgi:CBS-domain-containing membrane protein
MRFLRGEQWCCQSHTERLRFFRPFVILLTLMFALLGGFLLHNSISSPGITQPWELLGGAVLFSLALTCAYFLAKDFSH